MWLWRAWVWIVECALTRVLHWLQRHDVASLTIVRADHHIGGKMELKEGSKLVVNVVARNAFGRVLPTPAGLVVTLGGVTLSANADGAYDVASAGALVANVSGVTVSEEVTFVPDNTVASLAFVVAADGTLTPADVPVGA